MRLRLPSTLLAGLGVVAVLVPAGPAAARLPSGEVLFPTDALTVPDAGQLTGRRLALPLPDCDTFVSSCNELRLLNELDGFDLDPRIAVRLEADPGDVAAEFTDEVLYVEPVAGGDRIGLNRFVYDPDGRVLYGHPVEQLADGTRYRVVYEAPGGRSEATFTTMSATRVLAQMRRQLDDGTAYEAAGIPAGDRGISFEPEEGLRTVFDAPEVLEIVRYNQTTTACEELTEETVLDTELVGSRYYAFGSFRSPSWLDDDRTIPHTPTRSGAPAVLGAETVGVTMIVPGGPMPEGGWPVAIFGPGITRSKYDIFLAADLNAAQGIATVALDPAGHAYGPCSEVGVSTLSGGGEVRFTGFGRGLDQNGDGEITNQEGVSAPVAPHPKSSIALRDGLRQTAADVMALVRAIGRGVDVDGDGTTDLRPDGVSLYAQSLGGIYGTMVMGVDPQVEVAALNVPGGPILDIARLSPVFRDEVRKALEHRVPCLLNGGRNRFEESLPLYLEEPVTEPVEGALPIQETFARTNWLNRPGSPETFAPLLRQRPLGDSVEKHVIYQFAYGDQTVPNPTSATIARAGDLFDLVSVYRNDRTATAGTNPHGFLLDPRVQGRNQGQQQVVSFLDSGGTEVIDPDGPAPTWEVPVVDPASLETLNYSEDLYAEPEPAPAGCGVAGAEVARPAPADDAGGETLPATGGGAASLVGVAALAGAALLPRRSR
ncbi:MAG: hypothetical protein KY461_14880 [Actinobacteria bacterium]|nr:hypothetical protein [Actinomycetota bacterium]